MMRSIRENDSGCAARMKREQAMRGVVEDDEPTSLQFCGLMFVPIFLIMADRFAVYEDVEQLCVNTNSLC